MGFNLYLWRPLDKTLDQMKNYVKNFTNNPKNDILSGLTVALALVPEAVAFAFVAGIDPLVGLYGAFMMGIVTALFGICSFQLEVNLLGFNVLLLTLQR